MEPDRAADPVGQARRLAKREVHVREVANGVMYVLSTGCQWRATRKDLPRRAMRAFQIGPKPAIDQLPRLTPAPRPPPSRGQALTGGV